MVINTGILEGWKAKVNIQLSYDFEDEPAYC